VRLSACPKEPAALWVPGQFYVTDRIVSSDKPFARTCPVYSVLLKFHLALRRTVQSVTPRRVHAGERGSSTDTAFIALRELIVQGHLAPGSWIVESDLAGVLKISRTPIRAALQWLQHEGYVVARSTGSKSRMMVAPLTLSDAQELCGIVGRIEGMAGRYTLLLSPAQRSSLVATLKKLNSEMVKTAKSSNPDPDRFVQIDTAFHDKIVEGCGLPRLLAIYNAIKPQTDRYWKSYSTTNNEDMRASCAEHDGIIASIAKGDGEKVESALQINWDKGAERLVKTIMKLGERGSW
jgi:DNA-binding GntR family transcriptional regulator